MAKTAALCRRLERVRREFERCQRHGEPTRFVFLEPGETPASGDLVFTLKLDRPSDSAYDGIDDGDEAADDH